LNGQVTAKIVTEISAATLLAASYEHFVAYLLYCAQAQDGEVYDTLELAWGISGVPSYHLSGVVRTRLAPGANVDAAIEGVLDRFRARRLPMGWFINPGTSPTDLGSKLESHGFTCIEDDVAMSVDLGALPEQVPTPDNLTIIEVLDPPTLRQWVDVAGISNEWKPARRELTLPFRLSLGLDPESPYRSFLAYLDGVPVATSELFLGAGVAAVVWVGTTPEARRQGIGAAITLAALREAHNLGYRIGALFASPMGYPVYHRLGFEEMCKIPVYYWEPK